MTDPLLTVVLDRWRTTAGDPGAGPDAPLTAAHGEALAADLSALLGLPVAAEDIAGCGTPRELAELLRERRSGTRTPAPTQDPVGDEATAGQAGIWYACEYGDPTAYNSPVLLRLPGAVDPEALRRALTGVVARHESLRTTFAMEEAAEGARLVQHIADGPRFGFATATAADEDELSKLAAEFATTRFDLRAGPLLDVLVVSTGSGPDSGTALLVNVHHAVFDGFSWSVLLTEWLAAYRLLADGREVPQASAPTQFREAVAARPRSEEQERASLAYWTEHLADAPPPLELTPDRPRTTGPARTARTVRTVLDGSEADRLREAAAAGGVTPLVVLLTAYALLLHRQTGRRDLTVGLPVSLRDRAADQAAIGHLVNTVVLRHRIGSEATGRELLAATRDEVLGAMRHKDTAFEDVVRALGAGRDAGRSPLFQTMVTLMPKERRLLGSEGAGGEAWHHVSGAPKYDLALIVEEGERELGLTFEYDPAVFRPGTVERVAARFRTLLAALTARPEAPVAELAWVPEEELSELAGVWHGAPDERAARTTVTALFEERAARAPDAPAVETVDGTVLSYGELNAAANRLARALAARGAGPGTRVAVRLERGPEAVTALLAVLKSGASVVPLDPSYPAERTALVLADARPGLLLVPGDQQLDVPSGIERFDPAAEKRAVAGLPDGDLPHRRSPGDEMYVVYTSGSTGRPKGVVINDLTLTNVAYQQAELSGPHAGASMLQYMSLAFDVSFEEIFGALCAGAPLVLTDEETRTDLHRLAHQLRERRVARVFLPYAALQELASVAVQGGIELPDLKEVYTTGEQLVVTPQLREFFGRLTDAALVNAYGPSEAHLCTAYRLPPDPAGWPERPPIGHTVGGVRAYVLDGDGRPVPFGVPGELYVGGPVLSPGYLHLPEQTEARFRPDPYTEEPGGRFYRTGDLVRCDPDEGFTHLGRADEQIKIRGYRIEPAEVEAALNTLPGVSASAVVAAEYGPGDRRLVAFLRTEEPVNEPELRRALARSLPGYLVPSRFAAVRRLPLGPTGKVDRAALAARAAELPPPAQDTTESRELTETEQSVAAVWTELLDGSAVGPDDDFFALGGHSLLAVRLRQRLQEAYGTELPLSALLATPTVAGMAARVEAALSGATVADTGPDLWADTRLPDTMDPSRAERHADPATAASVLLTGVTGFLGVYLLRSLLADGRTVHCLVRASSAEEGMERLRENARRYRADDGLDLTRVRVVAGDLAEERFGLTPDAYRELAGSVEAVYHAAAHINFAAPYASVKPTNVDGFVRVAEFCADTVVKPLHLMSTLAVFSPEGPSDIDEETVPETPERLGIGYAQSKWVAERLALAARERGLPVTVHRIGRIGPATGTGAIRTDDFFWLQVKSFLKLGIAPERPGPPVDLLPADLVADAVVLLSRAEAAANGTTHVFHPVGMDWETVFEALASLGARPRPVSAEEWLAALEAGPTDSTDSTDSGDRSLASLVPLFREGVMELGDHRYGNESTVRLLKELGLELPPADPSWITAMVRYFEETGQLATAPRTT